MEYLLNQPWLFGFLVALVLASALEIGRRAAVYYHIHEDTIRKNHLAGIVDGTFVLVYLMLGFTLALTVPHFADRRSLIIDEAVSIARMYRYAGVLQEPFRDHSRQLLRQYVDARLDLDSASAEASQLAEASSRSKRIQEQLWDDELALAQLDRSALVTTYLNAMNEAIALHDKRVASLENRIPHSIWFLILSVSLIAVFTRGLTLERRFWLTLILAPITIAIVVALVADIDAPSSGLIQTDQRAMQRLKTELNGKPGAE